MTAGRVLAFDPGSTRIGVAVSDPLRILATPLEVFATTETEQRVRQLVSEYAPTDIVIGLPVGLSGREGPAAVAAREFGRRVEAIVDIPVHYVDERFTTATAEAAMLEGGVRRRERRRNVDKVAAAVILRQFLDRLDRPDRDGAPPR